LIGARSEPGLPVHVTLGRARAVGAPVGSCAFDQHRIRLKTFALRPPAALYLAVVNAALDRPAASGLLIGT